MKTAILQNAKKILNEKISEIDSIIFVYEKHIQKEGEKNTLIWKIVGLLIPSALMIIFSLPISNVIEYNLKEYTNSLPDVYYDSTVIVCLAIISVALFLLTFVYKYSCQLMLVSKITNRLHEIKCTREKVFNALNSVDTYSKTLSSKLNESNQTINGTGDFLSNIDKFRKESNSLDYSSTKTFEALYAAMYWISMILVTIALLLVMYPLIVVTIKSSYDSNIANIAGGAFVVVTIIGSIIVQALFLSKKDTIFAGSYLSGLAITPVAWFSVTAIVYILTAVVAIIGAIIVIAIIIGIIAALLSS